MIHISSERVHEIVAQFPKVKVLVIGDVMLDEFVWGSVNRISPEAPVPVVEVKSRSTMPGGAANVVSNIRSLGAQAALIGICGKDLYGQTLKQQLEEMQVDIEGLIEDKARPTSLKTRIIAHHQQVVRVDEESKAETAESVTKKVAAVLESKIKQADLVVVEDYDKGLIDQTLLDQVIQSCEKHKKVLAVDPKKGHFLNYKGVSVLTPNKNEALAALGIEHEDRAPSKEEIGSRLNKKWGCKNVLVTLGEEGMILTENGDQSFHIPAVAREVFDVSGAGDTVIAAFVSSLASGASFREAAEISNYAAGVVVAKVGTATVTASELYREMKIEHILES